MLVDHHFHLDVFVLGFLFHDILFLEFGVAIRHSGGLCLLLPDLNVDNADREHCLNDDVNYIGVGVIVASTHLQFSFVRADSWEYIIGMDF